MPLLAVVVYTISKGATENAGVENVAPSKMHGRKTQEWKTRHEMTWVENAGVEKVARSDTGGKRGSGKRGTR